MLKDLNTNQTKMLRNVSHEFRNPINCMLSMMELLQQKLGPQSKLIEDYILPALNSGK
jgi:signal transduction histidine kinase